MEDTGPNPAAPITLKLKFQPEVLYRLYDDFDDELITRNPDGTSCVAIGLPLDEWVFGYILSYGSNVEVLEPPQVRREIQERLKRALEFYQ